MANLLSRDDRTPKERPIVFSGPSVQAILEGHKTQTRRVCKPQPDNVAWDGEQWYLEVFEPKYRQVYCPYGVPGDRLWVRETFQYHCGDRYGYRADGFRENDLWPWLPSVHMPRCASRITLEVTDIWVERLQEISYDDAIAEGVVEDAHGVRSECPQWFAELWNELNAKRGYPWESNPWVWAISFRRIETKP